MRELNQAERKVLTILEENCRLPASQIAKRARLSPEGVIKIIERLQKSGVIRKFNTMINYSRIGYELYPVHIKLLRLNKAIMQEIKQKISSHKTCTWFTFCEGEYDLLLSFKIRSEQDKQDMDALLVDLSENTTEKDLSIVQEAFELSKSFIKTKHKGILFQTLKHDLPSVELSSDEMAILSLLKANSRETILDIASKIGMSARAASSKIKKMQKLQVISGFKTKINPAALNNQPCIALIRFGKYTKTDLAKLLTYCQYKKGINYLVWQMGKYDLELTIDAESVNDFYGIMDELREEFSFIKKITTLIVK